MLLSNIVSATVVALALSAGLAMSAAAQDRSPDRTISVQATGVALAEPDVAVISTGVVSEADSAREALDRNSAQMGKLVEGLKAMGIAPADLQTTQVSIEPRYNQPRDGRPPTVAGYRAVNQVRITARQIGRLGEVLDQAVTLGANQLGGVEFQVSKAEELRDEARRQAIANALRRAKLYASAAGAEVGQVITISEDADTGPRPYLGARMAMTAPVPVERGTQALEAHVTVTWQLK